MEKGIIFGTGYLGTRISEESGYRAVSRAEVDATNLNQIRAFLDRERPDIILNAVGKTEGPGLVGIDWCEVNKEETIQSNVIAAINLCTEASKRGIYFVHLGSGCIYYGDNNGKGFSENDEPNFYGPQFYAKTKILSEKALSEFSGLILRLRMPLDNMPHRKNLIDKVKKYSKLIDVQNSMTTVPDMIIALKQLIDKRADGIYNFVNPGTISIAEVMQLYKEIVDTSHRFEIFSLEELDSITKGKRSNCFLDSSKLKLEGVEMPEIHEAVRKCLSKYKGNLLK